MSDEDVIYDNNSDIWIWVRLGYELEHDWNEDVI